MIRSRQLQGNIDASQPEQVRRAIVRLGNTINEIVLDLEDLDRRIEAVEAALQQRR